MDIATVLQKVEYNLDQAESQELSWAMLHVQIAQALALAKIAEELTELHEIAMWSEANERRIEEMQTAA